MIFRAAQPRRDDVVSVLTGDAEEWKQRAAKRPDTTSNPGGFGDILTMLLFDRRVLADLPHDVGRMGATSRKPSRQPA